MMTRRTICCVVVALALCTTGAMAQPTFTFDFDPFTDGMQEQTTATVGDRFEVNIVMQGVDDLLGYSTSVSFDPDLLSLMDVRENPGDLNFDSKVSLSELNNVIGFFVQNIKTGRNWVLTSDTDECFIDGNQNKSGVLVDLDGNNQLSLSELNRVIGDFVDDIKDPTGATQRIVYWTDLLASRQGFGFNESVEVSDPPAISNKGQVGEGIVQDITGVLLARPDVAETERLGFGYDTSTLGPAHLVTLKFEAKAAGTPQLNFVDPVYILEDFADINTDVKTDAQKGVGAITIVATP